jgi:hypothetical protein
LCKFAANDYQEGVAHATNVTYKTGDGDSEEEDDYPAGRGYCKQTAKEVSFTWYKP